MIQTKVNQTKMWNSVQPMSSSTSSLLIRPAGKSVQFGCSESSTLITSIAALSTVNVPRLQSISFLFKCDTSIFANSTFLTVPTLETLFLAIPSICISDFTVNWEILTSLTLMGYCCGSNRNLSAREIALILQKTKCLTFCHIEVDYNQDSTLRVDYPSKSISRF